MMSRDMRWWLIDQVWHWKTKNFDSSIGCWPVQCAHTNVLIHTHSGPVVRLEFLNSCLINYLGTRNNISDFGPHILIIIQAIIYSLKMQDIYMDRSYTKLNRSNICIMGAAVATFLGSSSTYMWVKWALAHHRESGSKHFFSRA